MRTFLLALAAAGLLPAAGRADGPPGALVIRPGGRGAVPATSPAQEFPDKPGFLVVRPQRAARPAGPAAESAGGVPFVRIVRDNPQPPPTAAQPQPAANPADGKVVLETWDAAYLRGQKVGYFHVVVREYDRDGKTWVYATKAQKLTVARFGQVVDQWAEDATMEAADGAVLTTRARQGIGKNQMLTLTGEVAGRTLAVKIEGQATGAEEVPWPDGVVGVSKEATLLKDRRPKPGESFDYLWYEGRLNRVVKFTVAARAVEDVVPADGQKPRKLLRCEVAMDPVKLPGGQEFKLPTAVVWADPGTYEPLKMESDMPTFGGKMTVVRTTKEAALRPSGLPPPDLVSFQSIPLNVEVPNVHALAGVVYRVTVAGDAPADKLFPEDDRQAVRNPDPAAKSVELHVSGARPPANGGDPAAGPGAEFLGTSFFLDWDDEAVKGHARQAAAGLPPTASAWDKARAVEAWVHRNMRATEFSQAMATCGNVAKTLSGDCTEYAMLAAGMCRALGVPARTAIGLVYAPGQGGRPTLAYHMWFEAHAGGRWVGLDATLGRAGVGPGHVKITDASWHQEKSFAPLLPVLTVLAAQPKFEILRGTEPRR